MSSTSDTNYDQTIETQKGVRVVRHKTHTVLAGEQRYSTDAASIEGLQNTPAISKGYLLGKRQPEDKTVYHLDSRLTGLVENRAKEGQVITNAPTTELPLANGYLVDEQGQIKKDSKGDCIIGPVPDFDKIVIAGTPNCSCGCGDSCDSETCDKGLRWEHLQAPNTSVDLTLVAREGQFVFTEASSKVVYYDQGDTLDVTEILNKVEPVWFLPNSDAETSIQISNNGFVQVFLDGEQVTAAGFNQPFVLNTNKVVGITKESGGQLQYHFFAVGGGRSSSTGQANGEVVDQQANTQTISEADFSEDLFYVLSRRSSNNSDLTLTRGGNYGSYEIRTPFTKLDSNTVSVPGGTDVGVYITGNEIKVIDLGDNTPETTESFQVGNIFHWSRSDTPPSDRLIPLNGQTVSNVDVNYPELWAARNFLTAIVSFNEGARTITLKNYNGQGRFLRGGLSAGVDQDAGTALPTNEFQGVTNRTGSHTHDIQQGQDRDASSFASPDASSANRPSLPTLPAGDHEHTVRITSGGDGETRPVNTSTILCLIAKPF